MKKISIVIPVFNEEKRISRTIKKTEFVLSAKKILYEIIIVNDGSTDKTKIIVENLKNSNIKIIEWKKNRGKGYALKRGLLSSGGDFILYMDGDYSTPIYHLFHFIPYLKKYDIIIGSRSLPNSKITRKQPIGRIILGSIGGFLTNKILKITHSDTQCGFKLFKKNTIKKIVPYITSTGWGFDFEILKIAKEKNIKVKELPIVWKNQPNSKVKFFDYFKTFKELAVVYRKKYNNFDKKKLNILAINDSITDSGIAYYKKNELCLAINEERFSRKKSEGGFPYKCLSYFFKKYKKDVPHINLIVFSGISTPNILLRMFPRYNFAWDYKNKNKLLLFLSDIIEYRLKINTKINFFYKNKITRKLVKYFLRKKLPKELKRKKIILVDHHLSHASAGFYTSGYKRALVASFDGFGDGHSAKIYLGRNNKLKKVFTITALDSIGLFYSLVTVFLGFKSHRHEGKITGLAAFGNAKNIKEKFPFKITKEMKLIYTGGHGLKGIKYLKNNFSQYKKEDVAAWLQKNTEKTICNIISYFLNKHKISSVCLAGGLFANVKINQKIYELSPVKKIYIYPAMGDAGLPHGSILAIIKKNKKINNIFLGPQYSKRKIKNDLIEKNIKYKRVKNIEKITASLLAKGKIIAIFNGRMEYGPRALGNRSILVQATEKKINDILNKKLQRTEFMPFAPVVLDKFAKKYFQNLEGANFTAKFMNISFNVTKEMKKDFPAAVHIDDTARPQILNKCDNENFYNILKEYYKITKMPILINTSFNAHEEPIVMSHRDAINSFFKSKLDYLIIEDYIIKNDS